MSTPLTRFEVQIPAPVDGTPQATAVNTFLDSLGALTNFYTTFNYIHSSSSDAGVYTRLVYGHITTSQQASALAILNTLMTSVSGVFCTIWSVTSEP